MINAKLSRSTDYIDLDGKKYCSYCGKEIKPDKEYSYEDRYEFSYYHCDCEDALLQMKLEDKINDMSKEIDKIKKQFPSVKYVKQTVTKTTLKKI